VDKIDLRGTAHVNMRITVTSFADLEIHQVGADTLIKVGDGLGGRILLQNFNADELSATDFLFAGQSRPPGETAFGGGENDQLEGAYGDDSLHGGAGDDVISGDQGDDTLRGGAGDDEIYGGEGVDMLQGGAGNDWVHGNDGNDTLKGGAGDDIMGGQSGDDWISGGHGDDRIEGGDGADTLRGGGGADHLRGDAGDDSLHGGEGADTFVFYGRQFGDDRIEDFKVGEDVLRFDGTKATNAWWGTLVKGDPALQWSELTISNNADGDAVIQVNGRDDLSITLVDVDASELSQDDFVF